MPISSPSCIFNANHFSMGRWISRLDAHVVAGRYYAALRARLRVNKDTTDGQTSFRQTLLKKIGISLGICRQMLVSLGILFILKSGLRGRGGLPFWPRLSQPLTNVDKVDFPKLPLSDVAPIINQLENLFEINLLAIITVFDTHKNVSKIIILCLCGISIRGRVGPKTERLPSQYEAFY